MVAAAPWRGTAVMRWGGRRGCGPAAAGRVLVRVGVAALLMAGMWTWLRGVDEQREPVGATATAATATSTSTGGTGMAATMAGLAQATADCWARNGSWVVAPPRFSYDRRDYGPCHANQTAADRADEVAYRWAPSEACSGTTPYLRDEPLSWAVLDRLSCLPWRILVVGDSLSDLMAIRLRDYFRHEGVRRDPSYLNVRFVRNDHVSLVNETVVAPQTLENPWVPWLRKRQFAAILLNRGPHYTPTEVFLREYRATLEHVRAANPDAWVIVRTTPRGHWDCARYVNAPPLLSPLPPAPSDSPYARYHWDLFPEQNRLLRAMIEADAHLAARVLVMDVDPATSLRADSHRTASNDCLHYCMPGPIDMWVELFGNLLLLMQRLQLLPTCPAAPTWSPVP